MWGRRVSCLGETLIEDTLKQYGPIALRVGGAIMLTLALSVMTGFGGWLWVKFDEMRDRMTELETRIETMTTGDRFTKADGLRLIDEIDERFDVVEGHLWELKP